MEQEVFTEATEKATEGSTAGWDLNRTGGALAPQQIWVILAP